MKYLYCSLFGHEYKVTKNVTDHVKEYICKHCKEQVTTNENGHLILLTPKYKDINSELEKIHNRRLKRKAPILDH
ncbi:MAG: hypothetical protein KAJ28_05240 [Flavobacteriaceae bacterium]|nr:hypothetical protein [Flavobacteriaceae bacterium]